MQVGHRHADTKSHKRTDRHPRKDTDRHRHFNETHVFEKFTWDLLYEQHSRTSSRIKHFGVFSQVRFVGDFATMMPLPTTPLSRKDEREALAKLGVYLKDDHFDGYNVQPRGAVEKVLKPWEGDVMAEIEGQPSTLSFRRGVVQ